MKIIQKFMKEMIKNIKLKNLLNNTNYEFHLFPIYNDIYSPQNKNYKIKTDFKFNINDLDSNILKNLLKKISECVFKKRN